MWQRLHASPADRPRASPAALSAAEAAGEEMEDNSSSTSCSDVETPAKASKKSR